ncbi:MAG TPA: acetyl-CoA carboxylase carboxyl transferase subunit alpha, partial [Accumulibacter sp.]|nr:acetyl-CoA carboxylase carboxyl transferase subunit alpha [Accumulibacter sp.]
MKTSFLDFEQPVARIEERIESLRAAQEDSAVDISDAITRLEQKGQNLIREIYDRLSAWQVC